jgi:hypothetical protein
MRKGPECTCKDSNDTDAELDAVEKSDGKVRKRRAVAQAIRSEKVHKVRWCEVQIDMLEAEQCSKDEAAQEDGGLFAGEHQ